ncbi:MAG TPA: hypothetical protein PLQ88_04030 [Blastocatellia bacterium]|nr:hypothetical protein [Blastocatellia bacterium]
MTVEIPSALNLKLIEVARSRGASTSQLLSKVLEEYLGLQEQPSAEESFAVLAAGILDAPGDESGPTDLSTNKNHLEGYGEC